ncbi:class I SAM-dependent methyltransferase [Amycolatopsis regifaucium]|uniref:ToxA protein n=1 Tax=Amycolatopsis regifaucium TaxID=546365 RepID=A0A154MJI1_9PSEU|nr:class I SAM-dependent methyltransferase [Amycolatopsis regifaucium]KZB84574.1 ToxA protein [Amycolatopsis regifaucium]OKA11037.1 ToxA protein [Amycolatopsis regifaucium]SFI26408.1 Methyltransferase domain-containing protein [Amycolatopsis regifaucium]
MSDQATTLLEVLPDLAGRSVLVVGCGDGRYPRLFRREGARRVIGVDADQVLIAAAQREEERDPSGISYEVHQLDRLPVMGTFDIVLAFLDSPDHLGRIAASLVTGGHLVVVATNGLTLEKGLRDNGFQDIMLHRHERGDVHSARKGA